MGKFASEFWILIKQTFGLYKALALILSYWYMGAMLFAYLEKQDNNLSTARTAKMQLNAAKHALLSASWSLPKSNKDKWTRTMEAIINQYDQAVEKHRIILENDDTITTDADWKLEESAYYVLTLFTTIGYGHIAPNSVNGRLATIIYGFFGIPLCLAALNQFAKLFVRSFKLFRSIIYKSKVDDNFNVNIFTATFILFIYTGAGVLLYGITERWTTSESVYFIFVSLSTIGFGDILPKNSKFFLLSSLYLFFGLAVYGMVINVFVQLFENILCPPKPKIKFRVKTD